MAPWKPRGRGRASSELGPRQALVPGLEPGDRGPLRRDQARSAGVDLHPGDQGRRPPGPQEGRSHDQVPSIGRVHPIGEDLAGELGVSGLHLGHAGVHRLAKVHHPGALPLRQPADVAPVPAQHVVVPGRELGGARNVVEGRRLDEGQAGVRKRLLQGPDDGGQPRGVGGEGRGVVGLVPAVVHPQHHRDHGGAVRQDVPLQALADGPGPAPGDPVPADAGVVEAHVPGGKPGGDVGLHETAVAAVLGDAVAVEHHPIAVAQGEGRLVVTTAGDDRSRDHHQESDQRSGGGEARAVHGVTLRTLSGALSMDKGWSP